MADGSGFKIETPLPVVEHDLTTPRGRLLYLRDVVIDRIPEGQLDMATVDCGTHACLMGWYMRIRKIDSFKHEEFETSQAQDEHMFYPEAYGHRWTTDIVVVSHAELRAHIDDVLDGRVR